MALRTSGYVWLFIACVVLFAGGWNAASGQSAKQMAAQRQKLLEQQRAAAGDGEEEEGKTKSDTTKKAPKIRKPLESYFFDDSTRNLPNFKWNVNFDQNDVQLKEIDTTLNNRFQVDYPFMRNDVGSAYLGNLGGASVPLNAFLRPHYRNFSFAESIDAYIVTPETADFYNVKRPLTRLSYFISGKKQNEEEGFYGSHAQNISPSTGFNVDYKSRGTKGYYADQKAREKNLSVAFSHTGKKYSIHAGYIYNCANMRENGGLVRDSDITDTVYDIPQNIPVNLTDARNVMKNNSYFLVQSYGFPLRKLTEEDFSIADQSSIYLGHSVQYHRFFKNYTDTKAGMATPDYYENWYINPTQTYDSIFEGLLSNRVFIQLQPWDRNSVVGVVNAGVGMDNHHYYQFSPDQYLSGNNDGDNKTSYCIYGSVEGRLKKYLRWDAKITYNPFGYKEQDMAIEGNLMLSAYSKGRPMSLKGSFSFDNRTPDYWSEHYFSNHYVWNNSFSKENETRLSVSLTVPHWGLELSGSQSVMTNKIYYNAEGVPAQYGGTVSLSGVYLRKDFTMGIVHLNNRALLQWSSVQEVVPVPLVSAYLSYFVEFNVVRNVLRMQIGLDGRYNTSYYAFGYNPAISKFYNQREKQLGNYPVLDAFVTAKWKRMRILVKLQHWNEDLFGSRDYFTVLHYPLNKRMLKFGFSWGFYD